MSDETQSWVERLQKRWDLKNGWQVLVVLIVFACTGFTVMFLKRPLFRWMQADPEYNTLFSVIYYLLILPVYNIILLFYGFIFGQFRFFWEFEKKMFRRISGRAAKE